MAIDFLLKSPTYAQQTTEGVRRRRAVIVRWLTNDYQLPRGQTRALMNALEREGLRGISEAHIRWDAAVYRTAYRYLTGDDDARARVNARLAKKTDTEVSGLRFLLRDGITKWADLERRRHTQPPRSAGATSAPTPATADASPSTPAASIPGAMADLAVPFPEGPHFAIPRDELERLNAAAIALEERVISLLRENLRLDRIVRQKDATIADLQRRLDEIKVARLGDLGGEFPGVSRLLTIGDEVEAATRQMAEERELVNALPATSRAHSDLPVTYTDAFLNAVHDLSQEDRADVIKALGWLTTKSPSYPSLGTNKPEAVLRGSPKGCFVSRAGRELRFSWKVSVCDDRKELAVYALYRRGDLPYSER